MIADPARGLQEEVLLCLRQHESAVGVVIELDVRLQGLAIRHILDCQKGGVEFPALASRTHALYYGDNLAVLRDRIATKSVDLIYLDPPFNSNASYNVLFKAPSGEQSTAQIDAFEDTWHWTADNGAELAFDKVMRSGNTEAANMLRAIRSCLGENDMMAYLAMIKCQAL